MDSAVFLKEKFARYYGESFVFAPPAIHQREFGVGEFGKKISSRHLSFSGENILNDFLRQNAPLFISFSAGYYEFPSARPMSAKKMFKSDLIYEFDADDIKTDCKKEHDSWVCSCGARGKGILSNCPKCGLGLKVDEWVCPKCLGVVKSQVERLVGFLEKDFGVNSGIFFNYSGSKGFHIHVRNEAFSGLSNSARIELVDFLTAHEMDIEKLGFVFSSKRFLAPKSGSAIGWAKIIMGELRDLFEKGDFEKIAAVGGVRVKTVQELLRHRISVLDGFKKGVLFSLPGEKTRKFWESLIWFVVEKKKLAIDRQTSVDASKIIRVPNTLHGSTGLLAKEFLRDDLNDFDGLSDAVVFGDEPIELKSVIAPKFYLGKQWWGPFENVEVQLPEFVAVYLVAKGHAVCAGG